MAELSPAQTAFYATAATVIPVLVLAYLVQMATLARRISDRLEQLGADARASMSRQIEAQVADTELARRAKEFYGAVAESVPRQVQSSLLAPLLLAIGAAPFVGEVCAFLALSRDGATHGIFVLTWIGLGTASVLALGPLWQALALMYRPALFPIGTVRMLRATWALQREVTRVRKTEKETERESPGPDAQNGPKQEG
jgi:hypothetical protein